MTRKDYELIASRIKQVFNDFDHPMFTGDALTALDQLALALSEDFKRSNPNFQPERFLVACGVTL